MTMTRDLKRTVFMVGLGLLFTHVNYIISRGATVCTDAVASVTVRNPTTAGRAQNPRAPSCTLNPYAKSLNHSLDDVARKAEAWLDSIPSALDRANSTEMEGWDHARFYPFETLTTCTGFASSSSAQEKGGSKMICGLEALKGEDGCVIYSIGSNNFWNFEMDMLRLTPCEVHTFDCTGPVMRFKKPDDPRLHFHHVCLAAESSPAPETCEGNGICGEMMSIRDMQESLGHARIDLLKMDIEGFEWPIFESWPELLSESDGAAAVLPYQIMVEVHYRTQFGKQLARPDEKCKIVGQRRNYECKFAANMVKLYEHLLKVGYAIVVRANNRSCRHCTELTLVRFQCH